MTVTTTATVTLTPPAVPTFYFIGVTTGKSSMNHIFPRWAALLAPGVVLAGVDLPLNAPPAMYRAVVQHLRDAPHVRGGLVTTHKLDLFQAAHDLFTRFDAYAALCHEVSCIARRADGLTGHALDPISSGLAWRKFVPPGHFGHTGAQVLCLGSGGAAVATTVYLASLTEAADRPQRVTLVDVNPARLEHARGIHERLNTPIEFEYVLNGAAADNDRRLAALPAGSVVINATGMGKDLPGSPLTDAAVFPPAARVWEFNYRGELHFLRQAQAQAADRQLVIEDGWTYFLHGWTQVLATAFEITLTPELFARLDAAAQPFRSS